MLPSLLSCYQRLQGPLSSSILISVKQQVYMLQQDSMKMTSFSKIDTLSMLAISFAKPFQKNILTKINKQK